MNSNPTLPDVSIILPCFNEENSLTNVVEEIHEAFLGLDCHYEILAIDDCSTDKTSEILKGLEVTYIRNEHNIGAGASRKVGIKASQYETIAYIDADSTYTTADLVRLLKHFPESDHVIGYRDQEMGSYPSLRKFVKAIARYMASILIWEYIADLNSGLRAFKKSKFIHHLDFLPTGFSCVTTMTVLSYCLGYKVSYISTHYKKRLGDSKFHPIKDTALLFFTIFRTVFIFNRFKAILFLSHLILSLLFTFYIQSTTSLFLSLFIILFSYILLSIFTSKNCMRFE